MLNDKSFRSRVSIVGLLVLFTLSLVTVSAIAKDKYEVAVIRWSPKDIYFNGVQLGQEMERKRIEREEGVEIDFRVFGANDVTEQRNALQAQLSRGVDGVMLVPWRGEAMVPIAEDIRDMGIPLVTSNAWVPKAPQTFVAHDNELAGKLGGEAIVSRLNELRGEDWPEKGGVIVELRCIITASFDIGRHTGYRSVMDPIANKHPDLRIETREAGCDGGEARKAVDDIVSRYGPDEILAVASIDGTMAVGGAVPAFKSQGMIYPRDDSRHIPITTVDGTVPELKALARGEIDHISVQPAIGEGVMDMRLLYQEMKSGEFHRSPREQKTLYENGDELWMPVIKRSHPTLTGPWFRTRTYTVPGDVPPDSQRIWSALMQKEEKGSFPDIEWSGK